MPTKKKNNTLTGNYKKQHGIHHKHTNKYLKVYWPYLPLAIFVVSGIIASLVIVFTKQNAPSLSTPTISKASLLDSTNQARVSDHLNALNINSQLSTAAQIKANDMAINNYWAPVSPSGQTPWKIVQQTGYNYSSAGENLAYGFSSNKDLLSAWLNNPGHRANVLSANYSNVGFGIAQSPNFENQGPQTIVVAIYASPVGSGIPVTTNTSQSFTTASITVPHSVTISKVETLTNNYALNSVFITGILVGIVACFLIVKHTLILKKWAIEGEQLIIKHPFLDIVLIVLIVGVASLNQTVGIIN